MKRRFLVFLLIVFIPLSIYFFVNNRIVVTTWRSDTYHIKIIVKKEHQHTVECEEKCTSFNKPYIFKIEI